jgi:hypothetical protein
VVLGLGIHVFRLVGIVLEGRESSYAISAGREEIDAWALSVTDEAGAKLVPATHGTPCRYTRIVCPTKEHTPRWSGHAFGDGWPSIGTESGWVHDPVSNGRISLKVSRLIAFSLVDAIGYVFGGEFKADIRR